MHRNPVLAGDYKDRENPHALSSRERVLFEPEIGGWRERCQRFSKSTPVFREIPRISICKPKDFDFFDTSRYLACSVSLRAFLVQTHFYYGHPVDSLQAKLITAMDSLQWRKGTRRSAGP
jgi:hypothetical protein